MGGAPYVFTFFANGIRVNYGNPKFIARPEYTTAILNFIKDKPADNKSGKIADMVLEGDAHKGTAVEGAVAEMRQSLYNGMAMDSIYFEFDKASETYKPDDEEKK